MGWVVNATPRPLYPREWPGTHCIGSWVGPRAGLDCCGKSRPHRDGKNSETNCWHSGTVLLRTLCRDTPPQRMHSVLVLLLFQLFFDLMFLLVGLFRWCYAWNVSHVLMWVPSIACHLREALYRSSFYTFGQLQKPKEESVVLITSKQTSCKVCP